MLCARKKSPIFNKILTIYKDLRNSMMEKPEREM